MNKGKVVRLAGFVGALGLSTVLVTTAIQGTGAYFTSSVDGTMTGTTGHLEVKSTSRSLDFSPLNPGEDQALPVNYRVTSDSTTSADIWLVFDPNSAAYGAFTGMNHAPSGTYKTDSQDVVDGGLGQYGHFQVKTADGTQLFNSYNLQLANVADAMNAYGPNSSTSGATCSVDQFGHGGSNATHTEGAGGADVPECGVPAAILLQKDLAPSATVGGSAQIIFGVTGKMSAQDEVQLSLPFQIVATQPGQYPLVRNGSSSSTDPQKVGTGHVGTNW